MKKLLVVFVLALGLLPAVRAQQIAVYKYPQLQQYIEQSDGLQIINFWATWCRPCVAELPHFAEVAKRYPTEATFLLVSLDFAEQRATRVEPFLTRKNLGLNCVLLDEVDGETWMGKIDPKWDGAIPATLVVNNRTKTYFLHSGELSAEELDALILRYR